MVRRTLRPLAALACVLACALAGRAAPEGEKAQRAALWEKLAPAFRPPAELASDFGTYRSPLRFDNGEPVRTPADWKRRRVEIRRYWTAQLGQWPKVLTRPRLEVLSQEPREELTQQKVRVQVAPDRETEAYLLLPPGKGPFPAALVVFYEPETGIGQKGQLRDFAYGLAKRGFVTLSLGLQWDTNYPTDPERPLQPLSYLGYVGANGYHALANLPQVDPRRIGVVGHSYGGKWAMFASCLYDRFAAAAWSDPGIVFDESRANVNYWEPWYLGWEKDRFRKRGIPTAENPRTGPYAKLIADGRDLHELHALMAPRPFLVSGGSEDPVERWKALNHTVAVNKLLGHENRVAMTNRPLHDPTPESNEQLYRFFEYFLRR
ncbi:MAG: prolyl oligopeptidase family serine peptidase [Armatimonadota bacterium]